MSCHPVDIEKVLQCRICISNTLHPSQKGVDKAERVACACAVACVLYCAAASKAFTHTQYTGISRGIPATCKPYRRRGYTVSPQTETFFG